ncbi:MAG: endonuclease/exonuclease/phosphatase family protein [Planctomycetales bacterium]|nr:endonuclease/exonuclease/phosphatase family protein [Planctomycetales bacterium]
MASVCAAEPAPRLRVLSYNIHYGQGNDGVYDIRRLAQVIAETQADLVGLQEVDVGVRRSGQVHQAQRLAELTGMSVRFGPTQHYEGGLFGNAVLSRLPILDVAIHPLPYTESSEELVTYPRGAIAVIVQTAGDAKFRFVSTHFQHNVAKDRLAEAKQINELFANNASLPTLLAGDMNATPESEPIVELVKSWSNASDDPPSPSAPSAQPRVRIDYLFYRPAVSWKLLDARVIDEPMASDHCPVLAEFELLAK